MIIIEEIKEKEKLQERINYFENKDCKFRQCLFNGISYILFVDTNNGSFYKEYTKLDSIDWGN